MHDELLLTRFRRASAVFDDALDIVEPAERARYVSDTCAGDDALREDVEQLLRAHDALGGFLSTPPMISAEFVESGSSDDTSAAIHRLQSAVGASYRVEREVARGGMAAVYLAHDVKHDRRVAIKTLDAELAVTLDADGGPARFLAEIHVTATLQHPNVLPLFDSGASDGLLYYVMPYVEGDTLRQRIVREGPLPVDEALRITGTVANAVAYAHAHGVIHRDIKPENILLPDGHPLVTDFGIALAISGATTDAQTVMQRATREGHMLGTPRYMSPEQASGTDPVDARTDVYSLGAVLYELLTGDPPHVASSVAGMLAKLRSERPTPVRALRPSVPAAVSDAVDRALEKRPADRYPTMRAFADALSAAAADTARHTIRYPRVRRRTVVFGTLTAIAIAGAGVAAWMWARSQAPVGATRFVLAPFPQASPTGPPTFTPDGGRLVYATSESTARRLFVRAVGELDAHPIPGTEGALRAFVSPDGKRLAFFTIDDRLKTIPIDGGPVTVLAGTFRYNFGMWGPGDRIVITAYEIGALAWLSAAGGPVHPLSRRNALLHESRHSAPLLLPDGRTVVFTVERNRSGPVGVLGELAVVTLDTGAREPAPHTLLGITGSEAVGVVDGWLLYSGADGASLMAVRFDAAARRVIGQPIPVLRDPQGDIGAITLARNGTLLYTRSSEHNTPVVASATNAPRALLDTVNGYFMNPRVSPDGRHLALQGASPAGTDVWIYDFATQTGTRLTTTGTAIGPAWSADGRSVLFLVNEDGEDGFWLKPIDGSGAATRIVRATGGFAIAATPDGRSIVFQRHAGPTWSIWTAPLRADAEPRPVVQTRFNTYMPAISPDGHWLAYAADGTGKYEVFVRPFPDSGEAVQVSDGGGSEPVWSADGKRIFFRAGRRMLAANVTTHRGFAVRSRVVLFSDDFDRNIPMPHRNYDVMPDGHRFVMIASADATPETVVVLGWLDELRQRLKNVQ